MSDAVKVYVNSKVYSGWKNVSIQRSMDAIADSFSFAIVDKWSGNGEPWEFKKGDAIVIEIDGTKVLTGYINSINPSISATSRSLSIKGRSKAGDLVDCSTTAAAQFKNQKLEKILNSMTAPFGINVIAKVDTGAPIVKASVKSGETIFDFMATQCKSKGLLLMSNADGDLEIYSKGTNKAVTALVQGENLTTCSVSSSEKSQYSDYVVKGQKDGNNSKGSAKDSRVKRHRPKLIVSDKAVDQASAQKRAEWELKMASAKAFSASASTPGWFQGDKSLWDRNTIVMVHSPFCGIHNTELLIKSVDYKKDNSGTMTSFSLIDPDAFTNQTKKKKKKDEKSAVDNLGWGK